MPKYSEYLLLVAVVWLLPDFAYAQNNSIASILCKVGSYIWGPVGSVVAMLGVIAIGLIAMFGKIQISSVLTVMAGIALVFGAQGILENLGINASCTATATVSEILGSQFYIVLGCLAKWFVGPVGKGVATLSMILLGLFASYGRISWYQALLVAVGIATMFGSVSIVQSMGVPVYDRGTGKTGLFEMANACAAGILSVERVFCNVVSWFTGPIGKGIGTLAIIVMGIGALFAKVSWGMTMVVAVGIAMIFGATSVIDALGGLGSTEVCATGSLK